LSLPYRVEAPSLAGIGSSFPPVAAPLSRDAVQKPTRTRPIAMALALGLVTPIYVRLPFDAPVITVMRGVLLVLFIPALLVFVTGLGRNKRRLRGSDIFMVLTCFWIILALAVIEGPATALISGSLLSLEVLGGYLVMRAYFTSRADVQVFMLWFGRAVIVLVAVAVIDHVAGSNFVSNTIAGLSGRSHGSEYRNGLLRATSTLEHPILYGTMCAMACVLLFYGTMRKTYRIGYVALCVFGCVLAMSSAPLLALIVGVGVMIYDSVLRSYMWRWRLLFSGMAFCAVLLFLVRDDPIQTLIRNFTIDAQTGFYRLMIWDYAGAEVLRSPWFGIGKGDWQRIPGMNGSVDTIWLVLALAYGIAAPVFFAVALLLAMKRSGPRMPERYLDSYLTRMRRGLSITICLVMFVGFTVHFWGVMWTLLGMLAGLRTTLEEMRAREAQAVLRARKRALARAQELARAKELASLGMRR
jgi:hypothetical protein